MNRNDILKLIEAGYNKAEIEAMYKTEEPKTEEPKTEEPKAVEPKAETSSVNEVSQTITDALGELKSMFADFKNELTVMNIMNSNIPQSIETADDVIAKIINPYTNE